MAALAVVTSDIASITVSTIRPVVILVMMYVETFITEVIVFIDIKHHRMTSQLPIFSSIIVNLLILTISHEEFKGKM